MSEGCHFCELVSSTPEAAVMYSDDTWIAGCVGDVPGWVVLGTHRHSDGWLWGLTPAEQASFGRVVTQLSRAIREVTDASHVYLLGLGELSPHFHSMLVPRVDDDMRIERALHGALREQFAERGNHDLAIASAGLLRDRLRSFEPSTSSTTH